MNWTGHTLVIVIVWLALSYIEIVPLSAWVLIPAIITSTLIDSDWKIPLVKHRGATHTLFFVAFIAFLGYLVTMNTGMELNVVTGVAIGGITHLGADRI